MPVVVAQPLPVMVVPPRPDALNMRADDWYVVEGYVCMTPAGYAVGAANMAAVLRYVRQSQSRMNYDDAMRR